MSKVTYSAYEKKQRGGRYVWGVLRQQGRKQQFRTVAEGEDGRKRAEALAHQLTELEAQTAGDPDRFLSWHHSREPLPLDRAVRDYARTAQQTIAVSTATRYRQFAERLAARLGSKDLALLQQEDIGKFVRAERADGRAPDPTINACVLLRSTILAARRTKDELGRPHLVDDPLPKLTSIARRTANRVWPPSLDQGASVDAWAPEEARALLDLAVREHPDLFGVCLFQLSTGCRVGEALAMRWSAVDLSRGEITIRLKVHNNVLGAPKTAASNRTIKIPQRLIDHLKLQQEKQKRPDWVFPARGSSRTHWDDRKYQEAWRRLRKRAEVRPLGTHAWRHFFISEALSSHGWTPAEVAEHVGCSVKVILERYAHVIRRSRRPDFSFVDDLGS